MHLESAAYRLMGVFLTMILVGLPGLWAATPDKQAVRAEKNRLKGRWVLKAVREGRIDAEEVPASHWPKEWAKLRLTFKAEHIVLQSQTDPRGKTVPYKIDPTRKPKEMDIDGGGPRQEWIYKLQGDTLIVAFPLQLDLVAGGTYAERQRNFGRPRDFKETKETAAPVIWVLKRVKR